MRRTNWENSNTTKTKRGGHNARGRGMGRVEGRGGRENQGRNVIIVAVVNAKHS